MELGAVPGTCQAQRLIVSIDMLVLAYWAKIARPHGNLCARDASFLHRAYGRVDDIRQVSEPARTALIDALGCRVVTVPNTSGTYGGGWTELVGRSAAVLRMVGRPGGAI